jgi:hypothetical protein
MGIMDHQLRTATRRQHMVTPLRPLGMGILITHRGTIPATGTVITTDPATDLDTTFTTAGEEDIVTVAVTGTGGEEEPSIHFFLNYCFSYLPAIYDMSIRIMGLFLKKVFELVFS